MRVRPYEPDDAQGALDMRVQAFSSSMHVDLDDVTDVYVPDERRLVAEADDGRIVGQLGVWPFRQVFGGRAVRMGGVGGVAVAMEHRRRGVGRALLAASLDLMGDLGDVVSTLYPSTPGFYRRWGWEVCGERIRRRTATRELATLPPPPDDVTVRPADAATHLAAIVDLCDQVVATEPGGVLPGPVWLQRQLAFDADDPEFCFVAVHDDEVVGFLAGAKQSPSTTTSPFDVDVTSLVARDWDAERALWHVVAANHPVAATVTFVATPTAAIMRHLPVAMPAPTDRCHLWMTRIVDAPGAIAARGWPDLDGEVVLALADQSRPANDGTWRLAVSGGRARLVRADDTTPAARMDITTLATLYTGGATARQLSRSGELAADDDTIDRLTTLFTTPAPAIRDYF